MSFLTTGELALFVPGGVILGAYISYVAQRKASRDALEVQEANLANQRELASQRIDSETQLAADARLWERRADIYTEVWAYADWLTDTIRKHVHVFPKVAHGFGPAYMDETHHADAKARYEEFVLLKSKVGVFASNQVGHVFNEYAWNVFVLMFLLNLEPRGDAISLVVNGDPMKSNGQVQAALSKVWGSRDDFLKAVREEMGLPWDSKWAEYYKLPWQK